MEGFAGFVGLMFGLVVLSVIITLVVCAVKRHRREWLQDGQRRSLILFCKKVIGAAGAKESLRQSIFLFGSFPDVSDGPNVRKIGLYIVLSRRGLSCAAPVLCRERRKTGRRTVGFLCQRGKHCFSGGLTAASALAASGLAVAAADLQSRFAGCVGVVSPP